MAAYSKKSLEEKLGYKKENDNLIVGAPADYLFLTSGKKPYDIIQFFTKSKSELNEEFPKLKRKLDKDGSLWISWPKKISKVGSDLDENIVMKIGLENGLVDVKVISVDEVWSGLKFVYRLKDRK